MIAYLLLFGSAFGAQPLEGGFTAWRAAGHPVAAMGPAVAPEARILNAA